jgi:hypothetical protein
MASPCHRGITKDQEISALSGRSMSGPPGVSGQRTWTYSNAVRHALPILTWATILGSRQAQGAELLVLAFGRSDLRTNPGS